jgi:hypothetical protein
VLSWGITFVTQKSTRSGSLFLLDCQYEGSPKNRRFKLFSPIVLSTLRPLDKINLEPHSVCLALVSCDELMPKGHVKNMKMAGVFKLFV